MRPQGPEGLFKVPADQIEQPMQGRQRFVHRAVLAGRVRGAGWTACLSTSCLVRPGLTLHVHPATVRQTDLGAPDLGTLVLIDGPERRSAAKTEGGRAGAGPDARPELRGGDAGGGQTLPDIAAETGRSAGSIRAHLKRIHSRLGVSRRADLVRMVLLVQGEAGLREGRGDEGRER